MCYNKRTMTLNWKYHFSFVAVKKCIYRNLKERPGLNERPFQTRKGALIKRFAMSI